MSTSTNPAPPSADVARAEGLRTTLAEYINRLKAGDVGSLPVIVGMAIIGVVFTSQTGTFFTATNFNNLIVQMSPLVMIAIGVVFVLLIAEIDLSIGYISGLAGVAAACLAQPGSGHTWSGRLVIPLVSLFGCAVGLFQG